MIAVLFLLFFNHCILWSLKDSLVIDASGAEALPFIKVWGVLPGAIFLTFIYTKLYQFYTHEKIFYIMTTAFLLFFALFAFLIYPYRELLHPKESVLYLEMVLPTGWKGLISMYSHWTITSFYVICELWNTMIVTVLFWGFANAVTRLSEATRLYGALSLFTNLATMAAGIITLFILGKHSSLSLGYNPWEQSMRLLITIIIAAGLLAMWIFRWMHQNGLYENTIEKDKAVQYREEKPKKKPSLLNNILHICSSKYLISIAVIVVAYNLTINLSEVVWKDHLKQLYPSISDYNSYISRLQVLQGVAAILLSLGLAQLIRLFGWTKTALITPLVMMVTSCLFFGLIYFQDALSPYFLQFIGMSPLMIAISFGSFQSFLSKACKYSVFDSTKEMAYIPLAAESKLRSKVAIDGIGARLGKTGSSLLYQILLILFSTISNCSLCIGIIVLSAGALWIVSVLNLGRQQVVLTVN